MVYWQFLLWNIYSGGSILTRSMIPLTLASDAVVDLHMHTTYSDGRWSAQQLIDYLVGEQFVLVSVTDHDRVDKVAEIQALAAEKELPVIPGVEMSTDWNGRMGHMLCYGFDPQDNALSALTEKVAQLQLENTYEVNAALRNQGYDFPRQEEVLAQHNGKLLRPSDNALLLREHGHASDWRSAMQMITQAGFHTIRADMVETVDAAHRSKAVCLIAHPGRVERGFTFYDPPLLDQLRTEVPIDGIEVYHPYHQKEMIESYLEYVHKHDLLLSTGSDTHCIPGRMPIKYRADTSRRLFERLGIAVIA